MYAWSGGVFVAICAVYAYLKRRGAKATSTNQTRTRAQELAALNNMAGGWGGEQYADNKPSETVSGVGGQKGQSGVQWEKL
mmetsp:Transcript_7937/g.13501  ORF Transcript_7937/g.13501 Transcript_7937/m.13501 type:complete len:81 (-) Transcript_7937:247-489(-)